MRLDEGDADGVHREAGAGATGVDVWRCSLRDPPTPLAHLKRTLSSDEVARCARLRSSRDRRRYATARGLLRLALARYVGASPRGLAFSYGSAGKPSLLDRGGDPGARASGSHLHFNLSHSDDLLLIAISRRGPVGVDVERVRPIAHIEEIARRWLSREEYRAIRRARTDEVKARRFFTAWTLAEARAKASGRGMWSTTREERRLGRDVDADAPAPRRPPTVFRPAPGFVAAVAFGAPPDSTPAGDRAGRPDWQPRA
jgi:4'-phosphopantetheinyl transferase